MSHTNGQERAGHTALIHTRMDPAGMDELLGLGPGVLRAAKSLPW